MTEYEHVVICWGMLVPKMTLAAEIAQGSPEGASSLSLEFKHPFPRGHIPTVLGAGTHLLDSTMIKFIYIFTKWAKTPQTGKNTLN